MSRRGFAMESSDLGRVKRFYLNRRLSASGYHEFHTSACAWLPLANNRISLGNHACCRGALEAARALGLPVRGCRHCCTD